MAARSVARIVEVRRCCRRGEWGESFGAPKASNAGLFSLPESFGRSLAASATRSVARIVEVRRCCRRGEWGESFGARKASNAGLFRFRKASGGRSPLARLAPSLESPRCGGVAGAGSWGEPGWRAKGQQCWPFSLPESFGRSLAASATRSVARIVEVRRCCRRGEWESRVGAPRHTHALTPPSRLR